MSFEFCKHMLAHDAMTVSIKAVKARELKIICAKAGGVNFILISEQSLNAKWLLFSCILSDSDKSFLIKNDMNMVTDMHAMNVKHCLGMAAGVHQ